MVARILKESFVNWGQNDPVYKNLFNQLNDEAFLIVADAFEELNDHKPGTYEFWWANEHMRYKGQISNEQMRLVHELMYIFLTKYARGSLGIEAVKEQKKPRRKAKSPKR